MKVLQVINSLATGGAEKLLAENIPAFRAKGLDVDLLVLDGSQYPFFTALQNDYPHAVFSLGKRNVYHPLHVLRLIKYLRKYDIVHVHLFPAFYWVAFARWLCLSKVKLVYTEHSTNNRRMGHWFLRHVDRLVYASYRKIICITDEIQYKLIAQLNLPKDKLVVIENGIDSAKIAAALPMDNLPFDVPGHGKLLLQVSSFQYPKDQNTVIRALQYLPEDVHLLLIGQGPLQNESRSLAATLNLENRVHFLGVRTDVPRWLKTADVLILSSAYEGLSLSCLEGMASGRPFVASDVPGLKDIVGGAGMLFALSDAQQLASMLNNLLNDASLYEATARKCLERAQRFDSNTMIEKQLDLYQSLV